MALMAGVSMSCKLRLLRIHLNGSQFEQGMALYRLGRHISTEEGEMKENEGDIQRNHVCRKVL